MKRLLVPVLFALCTAAAAFASEELYTKKLVDTKTVTAPSTNYTEGVELSQYKPFGKFAVVWDASGLAATGTTSALAWEISADGITYFSSNVVTGFTKTDGRAANGKEYYNLPDFVAPYIRLRYIILGSTGGVVNAWLIIR